MKLLVRPAAPQSLSNFRHGLHRWKEDYIRIESNNQDIWTQIDIMQNGFCAYCECILNNKHVEHFRKRDLHPVLTFSWDNLFGSCNNRTRCGRYRDDSKAVGPYDPSEIVKPDEEVPSQYLLFLTTGTVRARSSLDSNQKKKAAETIRVFNLNGDTALINSRRTALRSELCNIEVLYELRDTFGDDLDDWIDLFNNETRQLQAREFQTALEHAWHFNKKY